jgi:hypothetical protein
MSRRKAAEKKGPAGSPGAVAQSARDVRPPVYLENRGRPPFRVKESAKRVGGGFNLDSIKVNPGGGAPPIKVVLNEPRGGPQ